MAAPTLVQAVAGGTDAGGDWTIPLVGFPGAAAIGNIIIFHIVQDGATSGAVTLVNSGSSCNDLAGTANTLTPVAVNQPIGSPTSALQHIWIGRAAIASTFINMQGANSTSEDIYGRAYEFTNVSTGTTLATVIENGTAGATANGVGTSTTVADTGVTTLGPDRLALQLVGLNDDVAIDAFAGETGGNWLEPVAEYVDASGTDGGVQLQTATMASAGTINGGSDTIVSAGWGVIGFALIGTTAAGPATSLMLPSRNRILVRR